MRADFFDLEFVGPTGAGFAVGMAPTSVRIVDGSERMDALTWMRGARPADGAPLAHVVTATNRYFDMYSRRRRDGRAPFFGRRGLVTSMASHEEARRQATRLMNVIDRYPRPEIQAAEKDQLERACLLNGTIPGFQFPQGGLSPETDPSFDLAAAVPGLVERLKANAGRVVLLTGFSYPLDRFKGGPWWTTDNGVLEPSALMSRMSVDVESALRIGDIVARHIGDPVMPVTGPQAVMFTRAGPTKKEQAYFQMAAGPRWPVMTAWTQGYFDRTRHVNAVAAYLNMAIREWTVRIKLLMRQLAFCEVRSRATEYAMARRAVDSGLTLLSDDLSGYDKTVSYPLYENLLDVYQALGMPDGMRQLYRWVSIELGTLAPGWDDAHPLISISRRGGLASGTSGTSVDGTLINLLRVVVSVAAGMRWSEDEAWRRLDRGEWFCRVWGDDTLIAVPKSMDRDRYVEATAAVGLKCKLSIAPVFLMTLLARGVPPTNLAGRTFMQSVWREHEASRDTIGLFGMGVRCELCASHPLWPEVWESIQAVSRVTGMLERWRVRTLTDLRNLIRSSSFKEKLAFDLKENAASRARLLEALTRGSGDLEDNPDGAYITAMLGGLPLKNTMWTPEQNATWLKSRITVDDVLRATDVYLKRAEKAAPEDEEAVTHRDRASRKLVEADDDEGEEDVD